MGEENRKRKHSKIMRSYDRKRKRGQADTGGHCYSGRNNDPVYVQYNGRHNSFRSKIIRKCHSSNHFNVT